MREVLIQKLRDISPVITQVTETSDMGIEFLGIVSNGIIYPEPGMMINYSDGHWPFDRNDQKFDPASVQKFLSNDCWNVIPWEDLTDEEIKEYSENLNALQN